MFLGNMFLDYSFGQGILDSIICIAIVFLILALICGIVSLFKYIKVEDKAPKSEVKTVSAPQKKFTMDDIVDDDMMAAALVATIDYRNECKTNVRLVSIKEVK